MQPSLHSVVQSVLLNADKENGFSESAARLTVSLALLVNGRRCTTVSMTA